MTSQQQQPESGPAPQAFQRNLLWRILQILLQLLFVVWFRYRARGLEHLPANSGAILLGNHQSFLDPILVGLPMRRPVSFVARDSLFRVPVIGWILRNTYVIPIKREAASTDSFRASLQRLQEGYLLGIFPEGTRSSGMNLGTIKPGFIALVRRQQVPVIPVGISGADRAMPRGSKMVWPARIQVYFGEPLDSSRVAELCQKGREEEFVAYVKQHLEQACQQAANIS